MSSGYRLTPRANADLLVGQRHFHAAGFIPAVLTFGLTTCYQTDSDAIGFNLVEPGGIPKE
jgi:hypothetical protein